MASQHILGNTEIDDTNVTLLDLKNDVANLKNKTNLVKHVEITTETNNVNITGLDILRDGGIYDIVIYYYTRGGPRDLRMRLNNDTTNRYETIRNISRPSEQSTVYNYSNSGQNVWFIGDGYNRGVFKGTLYVLSELTVRCARLQGQSIVAEPSRKSIIDCGCYFNPDDGVANVTSIQILLDYFVAGHIFIYKRDN